MKVYVRKEKGEWHILQSPDGTYPAGGYIKHPTGCSSKEELRDKLSIEKGEPVKIISI